MSDINEMNAGPRWYVAHTYSGYENKVKTNLEKIIENRGLQDMIFDVRVPVETIVESDGVTEREVESKLFPAYVLVKMIMTDETWHVVRNISGVTGFVGPGSKPVPLTEEEAAAIIDEEHTTVTSTLNVGDMVDIVDGIFAGYSGKLAEVSASGSEITVIVSTVGRDMPIKLDMKCVRRKAN
ncbi:MAG: transcription termination/antitermination protein NusG [Clostridia bacterium]|nr:transcription termination/antitermination protein NusG [Clostridia bacterium]